MKKHKFLSAIFLIPFLWLGCTPHPQEFEPNAGKANFNSVVAIGGSYMAGYQDGALYSQGQENSIPALIAEQLKYVGCPTFSQMLIPENQSVGLNSKTWESNFVNASKLGYKTDCKGITSLSPIKNKISDILAHSLLNAGNKNQNNNLSLPFVSLNDYNNPAIGLAFGVNNQNPFYNRIASNPGVSTIIDDIKSKSPTFIISWLGMDDIYNYASVGGDNKTIPTPNEFEQNLDNILGYYARQGVKGVMATIPDFRNFPYYTLIKWNNAVLTQNQADSLNDFYSMSSIFDHIRFTPGNNGFVVADSDEPSGFRKMKEGEYITLSVPTDSMKCFKYGLVINFMGNRYSLIEKEVKIIEEAINSYNQIIIKKANEYDFALADINLFFNKVNKGIKWNGADFNLEFVSGGFLSLDGYHPNQKGYGILANEFIKAINIKYNAKIPETNCTNCNGVLFN